MEDWERRFRRKLLDYLKAPWDVDLYTVQVNSTWEPGYAYSEYTAEPAGFEITISYIDPRDGRDRYHSLRNDECADFLRGLV